MKNDETDDLLDSLLNDNEENTDAFAEENQVLAPLLDEIKLISDQGIRLFTRAMLLGANPYFWESPSSLSKQYHPEDEHGEGGNVLHTKRVVALVHHMIQAQDRDQVESDILLAAAILHDVTKFVQWKDGTWHYDFMHPYTVEGLLGEIRSNESPDNMMNQSTSLMIDDVYLFEVMRVIRCHLGKWSPIPETYPNSAIEWILHFADSIATSYPSLMSVGDS